MKAFDSVLIAAVLEALKDQAIEEAYTRLLEDIYNDCTGKIILHIQSDKFPIRKVVKYGDTARENYSQHVWGVGGGDKGKGGVWVT